MAQKKVGLKCVTKGPKERRVGVRRTEHTNKEKHIAIGESRWEENIKKRNGKEAAASKHSHSKLLSF